jgi:toxin FitB
VLDLFVPRILPFNTAAARRYADLAVEARAARR